MKSEEIKSVRDSNFELCRLVCMLYIVIYHLIIHVPEVYHATMWARPLRTICHIGVVVFVMISGYYGINRKWKSLIKLFASVSFYNILGVIVSIFLFDNNFEWKSCLPILFPFSKGGYWFITSYAVLYIVSPYINTFLTNLSKTDFLRYLAALSLCVFYGGGVMGIEILDGRGLLAFVLSYSIGYFIHRYYYDGVCYHFQRGRIFLLYCLVCLAVFALVAFSPTILSRTINYLFFGYNELGLYLMSIIFFLMFQKIKFKSKIVNWCSSSTLGIYLLHENWYIGGLLIFPLYGKLAVYIGNQWTLLLCHIMIAVLIVFVCVLIDKLRQWLFDFCMS